MSLCRVCGSTIPEGWTATFSFRCWAERSRRLRVAAYGEGLLTQQQAFL